MLYSLYELYEYVGAFERSGELGEEILDLAHHRQEATFFLGAYDARACTAFHLGAFAQVLTIRSVGCPSMILSTTERWPRSTARIWESLASIGRPWPCGFWAIRTKRCSGFTRP